jgi:hypothetical protein
MKQGDTQGDTPVQGDTGGYGGATYAPAYPPRLTSADLDFETQRAIYDVAVLLYERRHNGGMAAVMDFAQLLNWGAYRVCRDCDNETPDLQGSCMVCGQHYT